MPTSDDPDLVESDANELGPGEQVTQSVERDTPPEVTGTKNNGSKTSTKDKGPETDTKDDGTAEEKQDKGNAGEKNESTSTTQEQS